jgi:hypothetical protein
LLLNDYIKTNRINLNGSGFRNTKTSFLGELGCYDGHYNCWKYIVENNVSRSDEYHLLYLVENKLVKLLDTINIVSLNFTPSNNLLGFASALRLNK